MIEAMKELRLWLAIEGCDEQVAIADSALRVAGITHVQCPACSGLGEWHEGPLAATSPHQISPEYRYVICDECKGTGTESIRERAAA